jgi:HlyD family secretion protein
MDVPRPHAARARRIRRAAYVLAAAAVVVSVSVGLSRLEPAAPSVERATVWTGRVERGSMTRQVRGSARLVPEETRCIPSRRDRTVRGGALAERP